MATPDEYLTRTRQAMDAVGSTRWADSEIQSALNSVAEDEWSLLLSAAPYYRAQVVSVTTASDGTFPLSALDTGTGNAQKRFYRILSLNDGNWLYRETTFADVPLAQFANYLPVYPRLFYLLGENYQILPQGTNQLNVVVNYKPTPMAEIVDQAVDAFDWPYGNEDIIVWGAAAKLLSKGGAEIAAAQEFRNMAKEERDTMLDDIRRRTIRPTIMGAFDDISDWAAG
jgi:hypothetical protein